MIRSVFGELPYTPCQDVWQLTLKRYLFIWPSCAHPTFSRGLASPSYPPLISTSRPPSHAPSSGLYFPPHLLTPRWLASFNAHSPMHLSNRITGDPAQGLTASWAPLQCGHAHGGSGFSAEGSETAAGGGSYGKVRRTGWLAGGKAHVHMWVH